MLNMVLISFNSRMLVCEFCKEQPAEYLVYPERGEADAIYCPSCLELEWWSGDLFSIYTEKRRTAESEKA